MRNATFAAVAGIALGICPELFAQNAREAESGPRFEVVSVKPNNDDKRELGYRPTPGRLTGTMSLLGYIGLAYRGLRIDSPDWTEDTYFTVNATFSPTAAPGDLSLMVRHLLEDRFGLKVHIEMRNTRVYAIVKARSDGALGPNLRRMDDCTKEAAGKFPKCGGLTITRGELVARREWQSLNLAGLLMPQVDRPVIDRTGLSGEFDLKLEWADVRDLSVDSTGFSNRPSLFEALEQQLGLKLESRTEPLEFLVVDEVRQPTPD